MDEALRKEIESKEGSRSVASVVAVIETEDGVRLGEIELRPSGASGRGAEFAGTLLADEPVDGAKAGADIVRIVRLAPDTTLPGAASAQAQYEIIRPDEERRRPETDHALLASLAVETGGRILPLDDLSALRTLPRREIRTEDPLTERLWNSPFALIVVILLATVEWVGRRLLNLL
jgi:hypothetical protein